MWLASAASLDDSGKRIGRCKDQLYEKVPASGTTPVLAWEERRCDNLLILIHGYNSDFGKVSGAYSSINRIMRKEAGWKFSDPDSGMDIRGFRWPSKSYALAYTIDRGMARRSAHQFSRFVKDMQDIGYEKISILTHSMGTYMAASAFRQGVLTSTDIHKWAIHGGDARHSSFKNNRKYGKLSHYVDSLMSFYSERDQVLNILAKIIPGFQFQRIGESAMPRKKPHNFHSADANSIHNNISDPHIIDPSRWEWVRHGTYKNSPRILKYTARWLLQ